MVSPGRPQPAYPLAPCHLTPCPVGDRPGALLRRVQERAEVFQFGDQSVLGGDHTFGAFALALVVRPVPGRALLLGGKLGFELLILAFSVQQAKWEPTSRIRDESNVPNAFHFSRRSRKRYSAETVPQPVTASQGTILCKAARNSVSWRCPIETAHCVAFLNTVRTEHFDQVLALRLDGANPRGGRWARCGQRPEQSL